MGISYVSNSLTCFDTTFHAAKVCFCFAFLCAFFSLNCNQFRIWWTGKLVCLPPDMLMLVGFIVNEYLCSLKANSSLEGTYSDVIRAWTIKSRANWQLCILHNMAEIWPLGSSVCKGQVCNRYHSMDAIGKMLVTFGSHNSHFFFIFESAVSLTDRV